ncbi:MAG: nucleotidyl transferase AbiEii/AbiGii toxin family protein [Elusimicrobia bacterium]|nr:nucleotidyl transferase AbiEii/AbiGii toxin family protein [Elusimicrobiota bacterium]
MAISHEDRTLSEKDLFGGKICAALNRQHPRDLFDIKYLLNKQGLAIVHYTSQKQCARTR